MMATVRTVISVRTGARRVFLRMSWLVRTHVSMRSPRHSTPARPQGIALLAPAPTRQSANAGPGLCCAAHAAPRGARRQHRAVALSDLLVDGPRRAVILAMARLYSAN